MASVWSGFTAEYTGVGLSSNHTDINEEWRAAREGAMSGCLNMCAAGRKHRRRGISCGLTPQSKARLPRILPGKEQSAAHAKSEAGATTPRVGLLQHARRGANKPSPVSADAHSGVPISTIHAGGQDEWVGAQKSRHSGVALWLPPLYRRMRASWSPPSPRPTTNSQPAFLVLPYPASPPGDRSSCTAIRAYHWFYRVGCFST